MSKYLLQCNQFLCNIGKLLIYTFIIIITTIIYFKSLRGNITYAHTSMYVHEKEEKISFAEGNHLLGGGEKMEERMMAANTNTIVILFICK